MSGDIPRIIRAADAMAQIQQDVEADVARWEGMPFTGRTVAAALGELGAMVQATARAAELLLRAELERPSS